MILQHLCTAKARVPARTAYGGGAIINVMVDVGGRLYGSWAPQGCASGAQTLLTRLAARMICDERRHGLAAVAWPRRCLASHQLRRPISSRSCSLWRRPAFFARFGEFFPRHRHVQDCVPLFRCARSTCKHAAFFGVPPIFLNGFMIPTR
jgi:hypothetical protein